MILAGRLETPPWFDRSLFTGIGHISSLLHASLGSSQTYSNWLLAGVLLGTMTPVVIHPEATAALADAATEP